jgi:transcription elongation factor Elf1
VKLSPEQWCKIQEALANLNCPDCFNATIKLKEDVEGGNAECEDCGCRFEFSPDITIRPDLP